MLELKEFCQELGRANAKFAIDDELWEQIAEIREPLKLVAKKMQNFQKADLTLSDVFGEWFDLNEALKQLPQTSFVKELRKGIKEREKSILSNTLMLTSVFLDPRYNILLNSVQRSIVYSYLKDLHEVLNVATNEEVQEVVDDETNNEADVEPTQCGVLEKYLRTIEQSNQSSFVQQQYVRLEAEIESFRKLPRAPIDSSVHDIWRKNRKMFPILYEIASIIMSIPPSEVSVERNFSKLNFILNRFRTNLSDFELEKILFLSLNSELFNEN